VTHHIDITAELSSRMK